MEDFEKNRVEHVQLMEQQVRALQAERDHYKTIADMWEPKLTVVNDAATGQITFGLRFGGKNVHASALPAYFLGMDATTATSQIVDALCEGLVVEQIRKIVEPELIKAQAGVKAIAGAGKW